MKLINDTYKLINDTYKLINNTYKLINDTRINTFENPILPDLVLFFQTLFAIYNN